MTESKYINDTHYIQKPAFVEAKQFNDWFDALSIFEWLPKVFYIPQGGPHPLRNKTEYNQSTDVVFSAATEFLILKTAKEQIRINPGSWIVKMPDNKIRVFTNDRFQELFEKENPPA